MIAFDERPIHVEKFAAQDVIDVINIRKGFNESIGNPATSSFEYVAKTLEERGLLKTYEEQKTPRTDCNNIDCGGTADHHDVTCEYMRELHGDA